MRREFVPKTPEPKDYFTGHTRRMERNDWDLKELAREVLEADPEIEVYFHADGNTFQSYVLFFKGEDINSVSFHEVPYHWSGCGVQDHADINGNVGMPFTAEDVLTTMHPVKQVLFKHSPDEWFKSKTQYLKWYSFYKRWRPE